VTYAQRLQDLYSACLMFWMHTLSTSVYRLIRRTWESPVPSNSGVSYELENPCPWRTRTRTSRIGVGRATTAPLALSVSLFLLVVCYVVCFLFLSNWMLLYPVMFTRFTSCFSHKLFYYFLLTSLHSTISFILTSLVFVLIYSSYSSY
jgi:hypothetical protein